MKDEEPWYDSIIYHQEGTFYLFTGHDDNENQVEHLFVSSNLTGPYKEHPSSPIYIGRDGGRNAGSIINHNGNLFRPVQVCLTSYGEQVSLMKIEILTPTDYKESLFKRNIINSNIPIYKRGGHQWNVVEFKGRRIVATDYRERNFNLVELLRRIMSKLVK